MQMEKYLERKAEGTAKLQRLGPDTYQVVARRWDAASGKELPPEIVQCNREGIGAYVKQTETAIAASQAALDSLKGVIADMDEEDKAAGVEPGQ